MSSLQFKTIVDDDALAGEIRRKFFPLSDITPKPSGTGDFESIPADDFESAKKTPEVNIIERANVDRGFEAIVERFGRPSLLVKNGTFETPSADTWKARLFPTQSRLEKAIRSVGRLELINHSYSWAGTAWIIAEGIAVTNRHVADLFAQRTDSGFAFRHNPFGKPFGAKIDFKEEHLQPEALEIEIDEILYVAENIDGHPDLAFLKLRGENLQFLPPLIPLFDQDPSPGQTVAVIGYPAYDDRNDASDMRRIFGDVYGVKRFAPGEVHDVYDGGFTHDCTTLGGNSGSVVIDVNTGAALGLHFAGEYLHANFAVSASRLRDFLNDLETGHKNLPAPPKNPDGKDAASTDGSGNDSPNAGAGVSIALPPRKRPQPKLEEIADRTGYDSGFLGDTAELNVPLPKLSAEMEAKAAIITGTTGGEKHVLKYTNFSIVMNRERRLAFFTATNVDGAKIQRIKRKGDNWYYDPRIPREAQVGGELYRGNDLDRGHLTRRLDPAWGEKHKQAEEDTFFFTNCTPQHHLFNTKTWLALEDYLLEATETKDFRATVFTGPVFSKQDRLYEFRLKDNSLDRIHIPLQYWKVVVMINAETEKLSATAYIISQKDLISKLEFVFGQFKTYQLPIRTIEGFTGLDFGNLKNYDPLKAIEGATVRELNSLTEIVI
jgi:endonuclease G